MHFIFALIFIFFTFRCANTNACWRNPWVVIIVYTRRFFIRLKNEFAIKVSRRLNKTDFRMCNQYIAINKCFFVREHFRRKFITQLNQLERPPLIKTVYLWCITYDCRLNFNFSPLKNPYFLFLFLKEQF